MKIDNSTTNQVNKEIKIDSKTTNKIDKLAKSLTELLTKEITNKEEIFQNTIGTIDEAIKHTCDNNRKDFTFTQREKDILRDILLNTIQKTEAREYIDTFEHLVPKLVDSIEQIMMMIPSPEP